MVEMTSRATADVVKEFIEQIEILPFGPKTVLGDNAACFQAKLLLDFIKSHESKLKMVPSYAPMYNGKAERMVGTMKRTVARLVQISDLEWNDIVNKVVFKYRRDPLKVGRSTYKLVYGVMP